MRRKRTENSDEFWEVTAIRYRRQRPNWKVWWAVGGTDYIYASQLDGVSREYKEHARKNPDVCVRLNISMMKQEDNRIFIRTPALTSWIRSREAEIVPMVMKLFQEASMDQKIAGVRISTGSEADLGCASYSIMKLFPTLADFTYMFRPYDFGCVLGNFIQFLRDTRFGEYRINPTRVRKPDTHCKFLLSSERAVGQKFLVQMSQTHVVGVEIVPEGGILYCAQYPGKTFALTQENLILVGYKPGKAGKMWSIDILETKY